MNKKSKLLIIKHCTLSTLYSNCNNENIAVWKNFVCGSINPKRLNGNKFGPKLTHCLRCISVKSIDDIDINMKEAGCRSY